MPRRVKRPAEFDGVLALLTEKDKGPFFSYKDALVFSAALGFSRKKRKSFERSSEPIAWEIFSGPGDEALVHMLALCESEKDLLVLAPDRMDDCLTIFEEYANGGLIEISQLLKDNSHTPLEHILNLIQEMQGVKGQRDETNISELAKELS